MSPGHRVGLFFIVAAAAACVGSDPGLGSSSVAPTGDAGDPGDAGDAGDAGNVVGAPSAVTASPVQVTAKVTTFVGSGTAGFADGTAGAAQFSQVSGLAFDAAGTLYAADLYNHRIRKITPAAAATTLSGGGLPAGAGDFADGNATTARFNLPRGIAVDAKDNVFVADSENHRIRMVTPDGTASTFAGSATAGTGFGSGAGAMFGTVAGIAIDRSGNFVVADATNERIDTLRAADATTSLFAGAGAGHADGTGAGAMFRTPSAVTVDATGVTFVCDGENNQIRKVTPDGVVTTIAGSGAGGYANGAGQAAMFAYPYGLASDAHGNLVVADLQNKRVRRVNANGVVSTLAGSGVSGPADGPGPEAQFAMPAAVAIDASGVVFVGDETSIRRIETVGIGSLVVAWQPSKTLAPVKTYVATASAAGRAVGTCTTDGLTCVIDTLASDIAYDVSVVETIDGVTGPASNVVTAKPN